MIRVNLDRNDTERYFPKPDQHAQMLGSCPGPQFSDLYFQVIKQEALEPKLLSDQSNAAQGSGTAAAISTFFADHSFRLVAPGIEALHLQHQETEVKSSGCHEHRNLPTDR